MKITKVAKNQEEMIDLGEELLKQALKEADKNKPLVFWLQGELGAGKTYFTKGIARALGIDTITSPTFVLMKKFKISRAMKECQAKSKKYFFHIDCYRVRDSQDAKQIELDKIIANSRAIIAIEWAERIKDIIREPFWKVEFEYKGKDKRKVSIKYIKEKAAG